MPNTLFRNRIGLLMGSLNEGREVRTYLQQFSKAQRGCFAVIKVGGAILAKEEEALAAKLALLQALGLTPVVVFGAGPQLDDRLGREGIPIERRDELRVTPASAMPALTEEVARSGLSLCASIANAGGNAVLAPPGLVVSEMIDEDRYGRVGAAKGIWKDSLGELLESGAIPLIGCVAQDGEGRLLNTNADDIARELARTLVPQKIVFLTGTGGVLDDSGDLISTIHLKTEYDALIEAPFIHSGMALKLRQIKELLEGLPLASSVSMTTTEQLTRELFTHGGAGTLIRQGELLLDETTFDEKILTPIIEDGFGRTLSSEFWNSRSVKRVIRSDRNRAAAVVSEVGGVRFLDKFAVRSEARGEGLAKSLWRRLTQLEPSLVWRSRSENPFNPFYFAHADGFVRNGPWLMMWYGAEANEALFDQLYVLAQRAPDFVEDLT